MASCVPLWSLNDSSRTLNNEHFEHDPAQFSNTIPDEKQPDYVQATRLSRSDLEGASVAPVPESTSKWKSLLWPALAIILPISLLSATLLALVFGYRVKSETSIFNPQSKSLEQRHKYYVLVDYSATRLVFAASFLSTVAPLLASFIMGLWSLIVSANMKLASTSLCIEQLPTPYQLSLLVGLCLASTEQLRTYLKYILSPKRRTALPVVLSRSAMMFLLTIVLAAAVFISDTALHYLTSTIQFDKVTINHQPQLEFGRGVSSLCLDLDRVKDNAGFPCSMNIDKFEDVNRTAKRNEMNRLKSNISVISHIRLIDDSKTEERMAILMPPSAALVPGMDYRASTVGVSTQCKLVPPTACNVSSFGPDNTFTQFNCSKDFFGVLGKQPNISTSNGVKAEDADVSPLAFKPALNLNWAFFMDANLSKLYNPESWDPSTNQPDVYTRPEAMKPLPDNQLVNPFYLEFAMRVAANSFTVNSTLVTDEPNVYDVGNNYVEMVMSCQVSTHLVDYTWYNSSIQNVSSVSSGNGSILEIFHGAQSYYSISAAYDMQQYIIEASIAGNSTQSFVETWSNSYSIKVLTGIGPYLSPRTNLQQQNRQTLLVAKVPKAALGALVGCSLIHTILGICLVVAAYKASNQNVTVIAEQLSLAGLTNAAFGDGKKGTSNQSSSLGSSTSDISTANSVKSFQANPDTKEHRRVRISGTNFAVWV